MAPLLPAGSTIINTAWYDNTANNRNNPDPDQWVGGGGTAPPTRCSHAWIAVTHLDEAGYQRAWQRRRGARRAARSGGGEEGEGALSKEEPLRFRFTLIVNF